MAIRSVVNLGSSFAAGPGIPPIVDRWAGRSGRNAAALVAERLGARLTDLAVSGATTATILDEPQRVLVRRFPPQITGVPADADLALVTAGGNDLGYIGGLMGLAFAGWLAARPATRALGRRLVERPLPQADEPQVEAAAEGLARVVAAVRERAPGARVLLVDYLTVLGPDARPGRALPLHPRAVVAVRRVADRLATAFERAAERSGAELVQVSRPSAAHGVGSSEPWVEGFRLRGGAFHPNAAGMRAVAEAVLAHLGE